MNTIQKLVQDVSTARSLYLDKIAKVSEVQARWKPDPEVWNIIEITEHLFWAEQGGIFGMWKTLHAIRDGNLVRTYESTHNVSILTDTRTGFSTSYIPDLLGEVCKAWLRGIHHSVSHCSPTSMSTLLLQQA